MPKHVKEAYRLLNKSIIRVDQPDIHLDEDDEAIAQEEMEVDEPTEEGDSQANTVAKKQLRLSYEEYRKIANLIVHYLRKNENDDITKSKVFST